MKSEHHKIILPSCIPEAHGITKIPQPNFPPLVYSSFRCRNKNWDVEPVVHDGKGSPHCLLSHSLCI